MESAGISEVTVENDGSVLAELQASGALRHGHFRLSSGLHSDRYVQCAMLLESPVRAKRAGAGLAEKLAGFEPDSVLSPALGGVIIGYETAASLGVPFRFAERRNGSMCLRRGFELSRGERLAVIEDVVTTGGSAREAALVAQELGAEVVAFGAIIDRSGGSAHFDAPFLSLLALEVASFEAANCELCATGEPLTAPGSRKVPV